MSIHDQQLDSIFHALADSTRRGILTQLAQGEAVVTELAEPYDMSLAAISKHLTVLEKAELIKRHKDGRIRRCELQAAPLETAADWITFYKQFWDAQLDSLENYLESSIKQTKKQDHKEK